MRRRGRNPLTTSAVLTAPFRLLPDYIIIGARCCGTTSLYTYISAHPDAAAAAKKELHFFDDHFDRGLTHYRAHFPLKYRRWAQALRGRKLVTGEASPFYLYHPLVPERIKKALPAVRMIVLLRNPIDRAFSHYQQSRRHGKESLGFAAALAAEEERTRELSERLATDEHFTSWPLKDYSYRSRGLYAEQLERWFRVFPREQFLVLRSEDLFENPGQVMSHVFSFLGLSPLTRRNYTAMHEGKYSEEIEPEVRRQLRDYYAPHDHRLTELLGRHFTWSD